MRAVWGTLIDGGGKTNFLRKLPKDVGRHNNSSEADVSRVFDLHDPLFASSARSGEPFLRKLSSYTTSL